MAKPRV